MKCTVVNETGGTITNLTVQHTWGDFQDTPNPTPVPSLADQDYVTFMINVGEGGTDDWSLKFTDADGSCRHYDSKQCNVEQDDLQAPQPLAMVFLHSTWFSIVPGQSSPCDEISYDSC